MKGAFLPPLCFKGAVINYAREANSKFYHKHFNFFHKPSEKLYLVSWPICAADAFLGTREIYELSSECNFQEYCCNMSAVLNVSEFNR